VGKYILELRSVSTVTISDVIVTSDLDSSIATTFRLSIAYNPISDIAACLYYKYSATKIYTRTIITNSDDTLTISAANDMGATAPSTIRPYKTNGGFWSFGLERY
jgi:hypothetical protein